MAQYLALYIAGAVNSGQRERKCSFASAGLWSCGPRRVFASVGLSHVGELREQLPDLGSEPGCRGRFRAGWEVRKLPAYLRLLCT